MLFPAHHPLKFFLLGIFTVSICFAVGLTCAYTSGKVILESVILTAVVVVSLTLYTFCTAFRGHDFSFLGPFLFSAIIILMLFALIQVIFHLGKISTMIYGAIAAIIFCGYIIYDIDNLIKRYSYDEYIWAAVALYLDIINLFLCLLTLFTAFES
ncbi:protein LIFEGUARD 2-like [Zingiber officinale]|uniref:protein LIFEGUARD 2-like n=1 Tax=Zingiber officinale TaxID=94328 RepID=UPI001C4CAB5B|nr:protein LIFEGUARD 2-like [Zingiber officinale]